MIFKDADVSIFKVIRLIKVLRPLRIISRSAALEISVKALFHSIPGIFNVMLISLIFFFIFGILGVNQLKGTLYTCRMTTISGPDAYLDSISNLIHTKYDCINFGGIWI